jgi:hypothetical protein
LTEGIRRFYSGAWGEALFAEGTGAPRAIELLIEDASRPNIESFNLHSELVAPSHPQSL